jgi:hypothetical protein
MTPRNRRTAVCTRLRTLAAACIAGTLSLLSACTGSVPEILYPDTRLVLLRNPESGSVAEVLRLYVAVRDPDGPDDPARIFLVHDDAELFWELARERWVHVEHAGDHWYGIPDVRMPDGADLPRGRYRVIVEDAALSRTEADVFITSESPDRERAFPRVVTDGDSYELDYTRPAALRVYNRSGQMLINRIVQPGPFPRDVMSQLGRESGLEAFVRSVGDEPPVESGPYALTPR